jgi:hypothetical protein
MKNLIPIAIFLTFVPVIARPAITASPRTAKPGAEPARLKVAQVPLSFESNQGQTDSAVKFFSRGDGYALFLTPTEAVFKLRHAAPAG